MLECYSLYGLYLVLGLTALLVVALIWLLVLTVRLNRAVPEHLGSVIAAVRESGYSVETTADTVTVRGNGNPKPLRLSTEP